VFVDAPQPGVEVRTVVENQQRGEVFVTEVVVWFAAPYAVEGVALEVRGATIECAQFKPAAGAGISLSSDCASTVTPPLASLSMGWPMVDAIGMEIVTLEPDELHINVRVR
jgi:hypothetical protein